MARAYFITLAAVLLIAALSWHPDPDHVPRWYDEICAQVPCP